MKYGFDKDASLEIGLYSLGDYLPNPHTGERVTAEERINLMFLYMINIL